MLRAFITNVKQMSIGEKDGVQGGWRGKCRAGQSFKKKSKCERLERQREATALEARGRLQEVRGVKMCAREVLTRCKRVGPVEKKLRRR